jgi:hypothetical protein
VIIIKVCKDCGKSKPLSEFYGQEKTKVNGQKYIYYQPYCKECSIERSRNRQLENHEEYKDYIRNHHKFNRKYNKKMIEYDRKHAREQKDSGYAKEYYEKNKDYFSNYNRERMMNKTHEISNKEWSNCKEYFNNYSE